MQNNSGGAIAAETIAVADQIRGLCSVITKVARADLEAQLKSHDFGTTAIEHGVLRHLFHGITSMAEISRLMGVAPSTLVYVVDDLTKKKLVKRGKDPKDRRREPLLLEKKGKELFIGFPNVGSRSTLVRCLDSMADSHRRELLALLNELVKGLHGVERLYLQPRPEEVKASSAVSRKGGIEIKRRRAKS